MRLAYLNANGTMGGAEMCLMDMLESVGAAEPDWDLCLVLGEDGPLADHARTAGFDVTVAPFPSAVARLGDSGGSKLRVVWSCIKALADAGRYAMRLRRTLAEQRPDVIHTNGFKMHVLGIWARPKQVPVIWHLHDYVSTRPLMNKLLRLHARDCAAAIANSESVAEDFRNVCGPSPETICVYNAVDLKRFAPRGPRSARDIADLDSFAGLPPAADGTVRIGLVATMAHWKGHAVFLRALARLSRNLSYRAYIIGGPIYQTEHSQRTLDDLRELASKLGLSEKVGLCGYVADSASAIRALDIVVHASTLPEPFGRVIAEGMACGRAVICSAAGGVAELVNEGHDALCHSPGDENALADRIAELIRNPSLRARLGRAARITAERRFDRRRLPAELTPLYRRVAGDVPDKTKVALAS